jgi:hypothetical protein
LGLAAVGVYYVVLALLPKDCTRPTSEFYVNDYANVISSASKHYFISKSEEVFDLTKDSGIGGLQIVVATYQISSDDEIESPYGKTTLFRKWEIGENDMGLLFVYYYKAEADGLLSVRSIQTETGYRLASYLSATAMGQIIDKDFSRGSDEETAMAHAYADVLSDVLPEAYAIPVTPFDEDAYRDYQIHYDGPDYGASEPLSGLDYIFSKNDFWDQWGVPLLILSCCLLGGVGLRAAGAGGSSGGAGIVRWKD